jgi:hypothetical protein
VFVARGAGLLARLDAALEAELITATKLRYRVDSPDTPSRCAPSARGC